MQCPAPRFGNQRGVILMIGAVALLGVFVVAALVFDFGQWFLTRNELQNVADTATLAGTRALGAVYAGGTVDDGITTQNLARKVFNDQQTYSLQSVDLDLIRNVVNNVSNQHIAGGVPITIDDNDVIVGNWDYNTNVFTAGGLGTLQPNAVRVIARRDPTSNTPLATVFGQMFNITSLNVAATATAAMGPLGRVPPNGLPNNLPPGEIVFPLGIDQAYETLNGPICAQACNIITNPFCIILNVSAPVGNTCTAWNTFNGPIGDFGQIIAQATTSPQTTIGDTYNFWGDAEDQSDALGALGTSPGIAPVPGDPNFPFVETVVPVYQNNGCNPPAGPIPIVGFVNIRVISQIIPGGNNRVFLKFACNVASTGRSGGLGPEDFGTFGSIPVLVE